VFLATVPRLKMEQKLTRLSAGLLFINIIAKMWESLGKDKYTSYP
jgi:hypothetical protein